MEAFLILTVLAIPLFSLIAGVLGVIAFVRSRSWGRASAKLRQLETEVEVLQLEVRRLRQERGTPGPRGTVSVVPERLGGEAATEVWGDLDTPAEPLLARQLQAEVAEDQAAQFEAARSSAPSQNAAAAGPDPASAAMPGADPETAVRAAPAAARERRSVPADEARAGTTMPPPIPMSDDGAETDGDRGVHAAEAPTGEASADGGWAPPPIPPSSAVEGPANPPPPAAPAFDLEKWLGLRGAAVVGGLALALAGLLFVKYSIDQGWIPPVVRVTLAFIAGALALAGSEIQRRRGYRSAADGVASAGLVTLYGATWASRELYELIPSLVAFVLMGLITAAGCALAWRRRSLVVAVIGLLGGFATPLLVTAREPSSLGLFGYLSLLNFAVLRLARSRGWAALPALAAGGTLLYLLLWVRSGLSAETLWLGIGFGVVVALLFAFSAGARPETTAAEGATPADSGSAAGRQLWAVARGAGTLLPFLLALAIALEGSLGARLLPLLALVTPLLAAGVWLGRRLAQPLLTAGAVAATLLTLAGWLAQEEARLTSTEEWIWALGLAVLGAVLYWLIRGPSVVEQGHTDRGAEGAIAVLVGFGLLGLIGLLCLPVLPWHLSVWPWAAGFVPLLAFALLRAQAAGPASFLARFLAYSAGAAGGASLVVYFYSTLAANRPPRPPVLGSQLSVLVVAGLLALGLQALAVLRHRRPEAATLDRANIALALAILGGAFFVEELPLLGVSLPLLSTAALALAVLAATRLGSGGFYLAATVLAVCAHLAWVERVDWDRGGNGGIFAFLALGVGCAAAISWWVPATGAGLRRSRTAWITAALAGPLWFMPLYEVWTRHLGSAALGALPLLLAVVAMVGLVWTRRLGPARAPDASAPPEEEDRRARQRQRLAWFAGVALGLVATAIPLQLDQQWVTVGWALQAAGLVLLWRHLRHPGLVVFAALLYGAVAVRLLLNPALLGYEAASGVPLLNWITYTYLVPILAFLAGLHWLRQPLPGTREGDPGGLESLREALPPQLSPKVLIAALGGAVVLLVFAWINLEIVNFFAAEGRLTLDLHRGSTQNLVLSLAWGAYAIALLALGIARGWPALRKASLGLLVLTLLKVFLVDLGELEGLYRVASLLGLAMSLILVSVVYQRFVVGVDREGPS